MSDWKPIDKDTPHHGRILVVDDLDDEPYITSWTDDVYSLQGGRGGPAGWFSGNYRDNWGDYPEMDRPLYWQHLPSPPKKPINMLIDQEWLSRRLETDPDLPCEAGDFSTGDYVHDPEYRLMHIRMLLTGTSGPTDEDWSKALLELWQFLENNSEGQALIERLKAERK